jgi:hypothetical protein
MASIGGLFSEFHEQVKGKWYEVEAALVNLTQPEARKRSTRAFDVRETSLLLSANNYDEEFQPLTSRAHTSVASRCQRSRCMPEDEDDHLLRSRAKPERRLANTAQPQMLHFIAPQDAVPGRNVCLRGPHGEPIRVMMPDGAVPGEPSSVYLGPRLRLQVVVPPDTAPGMTVWFESEGDMLHTVVPPGKKPGDTLEIVPPVILIQVPQGVKGGDEVMFRTPEGTMAVTEVPEGYFAGHYFATMPPMDPHLMERCLKDVEREGELMRQEQGPGAEMRAGPGMRPCQAKLLTGYGTASSSTAPVQPSAEPAELQDLLEFSSRAYDQVLE